MHSVFVLALIWNLFTPSFTIRGGPIPDEHKLEMDVDVEKLRKEILLWQPAPSPQCDSSPRRLPAVGTWLNEPGTPHAESQSTERERFYFILFFCTSAEQVWSRSGFCLQPDVGVDGEGRTATLEQPAACEEFAGPSKKQAAARDDSMGKRPNQTN